MEGEKRTSGDASRGTHFDVILTVEIFQYGAARSLTSSYELLQCSEKKSTAYSPLLKMDACAAKLMTTARSVPTEDSTRHVVMPASLSAETRAMF